MHCIFLECINETDAPYSLFIYFPNDFSLSEIESSAKLSSKRVDDNVLEVTMIGKEEIVNWTISYK